MGDKCRTVYNSTMPDTSTDAEVETAANQIRNRAISVPNRRRLSSSVTVSADQSVSTDTSSSSGGGGGDGGGDGGGGGGGGGGEAEDTSDALRAQLQSALQL